MPSQLSPDGEQSPSAWVRRWAGQIPGGGRVLDVACGAGRHARYLSESGFVVDAVDRDLSGCAAIAGLAQVTLHQADLEGGVWPFGPAMFQGVVVTHYLHRPLFPRLVESLAPGGVLIYETFALGNERYGRPRNPNFLLLPGELLEVVRGRLQVVAYEEVVVDEPRPARLQRICASR